MRNRKGAEGCRENRKEEKAKTEREREIERTQQGEINSDGESNLVKKCQMPLACSRLAAADTSDHH
jgi:hypothetical protein